MKGAIATILLFLGSGVAAAPVQDPPPAAGAPLRVDGAVTRPEKISGEPPVYTEEARRARVQGTVITEAIIDERGDVVNVRVLKGLPMGLDQAAADAVRTWKFKPATLEGKPVKVYYVLTVNFKVDDSRPPLGPLLQDFLKENPELAAHFTAKRYKEAAELLGRLAAGRPTDPAISIARCYLLLEQGGLDEAWERARASRGADAYEMLYLVGLFARERAARGGVLSAEARAAAIDLGLQAETLAIEARSDGLEAMLLKLLLLVDKFELTTDPAERLELQREGIELRQRAMEVYGRQSGDNPQD